MNKFTLGAISGITTLAVAFPLVAQVTSAQSSSAGTAANRPVPSQDCVQALAAQEDAMLANFDTHTAAHKAAMTAHRDALKAAGAIADDALRQAALEKAHLAMKKSMQRSAPAENSMKATMDAVKAACGDSIKIKHAFGTHMDEKGKFMMRMHKSMKGKAPASAISQ